MSGNDDVHTAEPGSDARHIMHPGTSRRPSGHIKCKDGVTLELLDPLDPLNENHPRTIPAGDDAVAIRFRFKNGGAETIKSLKVTVSTEFADCEVTDHDPSQHFERVFEYRAPDKGPITRQQRKPSSSIQYRHDGIPVGSEVDCGMVLKLRNMRGLPASEVKGAPVKFWQPLLRIEAGYQFVEGGSDCIVLHTSPAIMTAEPLLKKAVKEFKEAFLGAVIGLAVGLLCPNAEGLRTAIVRFLNALSAAVGGGQ